jgi:hypothetical protein
MSSRVVRRLDATFPVSVALAGCPAGHGQRVGGQHAHLVGGHLGFPWLNA